MKRNLVSAIFLITYHLLLFIGLPFYLIYFPVYSVTILISILLLVLSELSITAGYHRFYSHKSFIAKKPFELFILFFGTIAVQGSVIRWAHDHRVHHNKVDSDEDPYSIKKGFWYAHFLWMFDKKKPINYSIIPDLTKNKLLIFQDKYYGWLVLITSLAPILFLGFFLNDFVGGFMLAFLARLFFSHHFTWFINSLAHTWGRKPYNKNISAVDNEIMAILTFGEGYHNYHHAFAYDYRNGIRWYHFDPGKWLIWTCYKFGLAKNLTRVNKWSIKKKKLLEDKKLLMNRLDLVMSTRKELLTSLVESISQGLNNNINLLSEALDKKRDELNKKKIKILRRNVKKDLISWSRLYRTVLSLTQ